MGFSVRTEVKEKKNKKKNNLKNKREIRKKEQGVYKLLPRVANLLKLTGVKARPRFFVLFWWWMVCGV